jgi:ABC-type multidrug transport system fused ATPase/permease subunit
MKDNPKEYRSSGGIQVYDYFSVLWVFGFACIPLTVIITGIYKFSVTGDPGFGDDRIPVIIIVCMVIFSLMGSLIVNLLFYRITIRVTDEAVMFIRRRKAYRILKFDEYEFDSRVEKNSFRVVIRFTARCLCAISKESGKRRDYVCNSFSKETFDGLIADIVERVRLRGVKQLERYETQNAEIHIKRKKGLKPYIKMLFTGTLPMLLESGFFAIFILFINSVGALISDFKNEIAIFLLIFLILAVNYILSVVIPFYRAFKNIPRKIVIFCDRLEIDGVKFFYGDIRQLKLTSSYAIGSRRKAVTVREMVIEDRTETFKFMFGGNSVNYSAISTEDYLFLYNSLSGFITGELKSRKMFWFI